MCVSVVCVGVCVRVCVCVGECGCVCVFEKRATDQLSLLVQHRLIVQSH